ncbi:hypothetical protein FWD20_01660 [Candidatus Saccharibacteria bacterium]|nr:hypothetical protein [Candidatus Saccharibacteria bacterium]
MTKTIVARVKTTDMTKAITFIGAIIILCVLTIPRYVIEGKSSNKYFVAGVALAIVILGTWTIVRIIQRAYIHGVISMDSKNLYIGRRPMAWKKIAQIYIVQKFKETHLVVTSEFVPVDKILVFEEDNEPAGPIDSLAYRINLSNFNLSPEKISQILNKELAKHQKSKKA